jgi:hypothetical protein
MIGTQGAGNCLEKRMAQGKLLHPTSVGIFEGPRINTGLPSTRELGQRHIPRVGSTKQR